MLWTPGTSELPLVPRHTSVPVSPVQLSAGSREPGHQQAPSGDLAALTTEPKRHRLLTEPEKPGREGPEQARLGYRRNQLEGLRTGITRRSGEHGPPKVGCFCTKPLTFLISLGGLKLPCIDSARRQKWGWPPYSQGGQVAGGNCRWHCQGRGGHSGWENLAFGELQSEPAELNVGEGQWGSSCPRGLCRGSWARSLRNCLQEGKGWPHSGPLPTVGRTSPVEAFAASQLHKSPGCSAVEITPLEYDYLYHKSSLFYPNSGSKNPQTCRVSLIS